MYYIVILISMFIIWLVNFLFKALPFTWWEIALSVTLTTVAVIIIDGIFATIVRHFLPNKWFDRNKKYYVAGKKECRFYEKLKIKKWKEKVPELGFFTAFSKSEIKDPRNNEYVERFILEANYGIAVHIAGVIFGFIVAFYRTINIGLWVAIVNAVLNLLPILILRYNLPKLHALYKFNEKTNKKQ